MNWPSLLQIVETGAQAAPAAGNARPSYRPSDRMEVVGLVDTSDRSSIAAHVDENPASLHAADDSRAETTKHVLVFRQTGAKIGPRYRLRQGEGGKEGQQLKQSEFHVRSDSIEWAGAQIAHDAMRGAAALFVLDGPATYPAAPGEVRRKRNIDQTQLREIRSLMKRSQ
ncbi:unnamed protein product [Clonostachys byssicola]|uniref:Uncharacterized protein n=1 Tax=Clonostachys byssicola TaxID=160290 RepID=A0A9N9Y1X4_9HYPO|nr:unnamed protein product [Clonostachys byssicola]